LNFIKTVLPGESFGELALLIIVLVISLSEQKLIVLSGLLADTHSIAWLMKQLSTKGTNTW
jgi:hypothetical protein